MSKSSDKKAPYFRLAQDSLKPHSPFAGLEFYKGKDSGANDSGILGGVYKNSLDGTLCIIKKENNSAKNISEFLGSQIFQATNPGYGAKVSIIVADHLKNSQPSDGSEIYVKSEFFKNYSSDMYADMDKNMSKKTKPNNWFRKDGDRPMFMGIREEVYTTLTHAFNELNYQDFNKIAPTSLLIGDFDIHTGNIGVIRDPENPNTPPKLVRIDFAGSLDKLENEIHPHSASRHLPGFGPTNHFREFPDKLKYNAPFVDGLLETSQIDLSQTIDSSFDELAKYYNDKAIANWAKMAMPKEFKGKNPKNITIEGVKDAFKKMMKKRQESLKEYAIEIKLGLLMTDDIIKKPTEEKINNSGIKELIYQYPDYFESIANGSKKPKIRKAIDIDVKSEKIIILLIKKLVKKLLLTIRKKRTTSRIVKIVRKISDDNVTPDDKKTLDDIKDSLQTHVNSVAKSPKLGEGQNKLNPNPSTIK